MSAVAVPPPSSPPPSSPPSPGPASLVVVIDVTPMLPGGGNGGAKWVALSLIEQFLRQRPHWRWWLLTTAANDGFLGEMFPSVQRLRVLDEQGQVIAPPRLRALPGGDRADLLFCPFTAPFHATPAVPTVSIVHDLQFAAYPQFFSAAEVRERTSHFFEAAALCDRLVCVSRYVAKEVRRATGLGERRVRFVYNSMADRLPRVTAEAAAEALAGLGLTAGRYLLYPANTWPHKNHAMLITAASMYFAAHPASDLKLVCAGVSDAPSGRALRAAVVRMGLGERILFPGFQDEERFAALVTNARALIFPSLFEGFGIPVLEAMANGVPVLCANTTSLPEIAGDAALLFDPRRPGEIVGAIEAIESDPGLGERLVAAGTKRAASLGTGADMAAGYLEIFAEVLQPPRLIGVTRRRVRLLRSWLAGDPMTAAVVRLPGRIRRRLCGLPARLKGRVQCARASLGRRLPVLRMVSRRLRALFLGNRP